MPVYFNKPKATKQIARKVSVHMVKAILLSFLCSFFAGCQYDGSKEGEKQVNDAIKALGKASDSALKELSRLGVNDPSAELKKLRQYEYKVISSGGKSAQEDERLLNEYGKEGWECFHIQSSGAVDQKLFYMRRRPETVLRYVPQTFLGR